MLLVAKENEKVDKIEKNKLDVIFKCKKQVTRVLILNGIYGHNS